MAKRSEIVVSSVPDELAAAVEHVQKTWGMSRSAAAKALMGAGATHLGLVPTPVCTRVEPRTHPVRGAHGEAMHHNEGTPCAHGWNPVPTPYGVLPSLLLEEEEDESPPQSGGGGAHPGGFATPERTAESLAEPERGSPPKGTTFAKLIDLTTWQRDGLIKLLPADSRKVSEWLSRMRTRRRSPLTRWECARIGELHDVHGRTAERAERQQQAEPALALGPPPLVSSPAELGPSPIAEHVAYRRAEIARKNAELAKAIQEDPDFEAKREATRRALSAIAANEPKPNHSKPQERGEEDPMESEPISGVEEAERPSGRAEPSEANTGRESEPQAAASREDGGAA